MSLEQQLTARNKLREKIEWQNKEIRQCQYDLKKIDKRVRRYKLIEAGTLFEKAGILYTYNPDRVLTILQNLKHVTINKN
jgi:hypothetical protein